LYILYKNFNHLGKSKIFSDKIISPGMQNTAAEDFSPAAVSIKKHAGR